MSWLGAKSDLTFTPSSNLEKARLVRNMPRMPEEFLVEFGIGAC
jgi:hypothetical protein